MCIPNLICKTIFETIFDILQINTSINFDFVVVHKPAIELNRTINPILNKPNEIESYSISRRIEQEYTYLSGLYI